jgi:hypothetical protein
MTTELAYLRLKPWKLQWPRYAVMLRPIQIDRDGTYPGIVNLPFVMFTWAEEYGVGEGMLFIVMKADLQPSASAPVIFRSLIRKMLTECGCETLPAKAPQTGSYRDVASAEVGQPGYAKASA